ncbi:MAG: hypothetical protein ACOYUK_03660 [Patescibacteria group bacterium]
MFETSKDLLYWVLAVSISLLTVFLIWGMYYIIMLLKRAYLMVREVSELIESVKEKLDRLEQLFDAIEEKLKHSASYIPLIVKGVTEILDFIKVKRADRANRKTKKSTAAEQ